MTGTNMGEAQRLPPIEQWSGQFMGGGVQITHSDESAPLVIVVSQCHFFPEFGQY